MSKPITHQVTITIASSDNDPNVQMEVKWDPLLGDDEIYEQGYTPAAYKVAERLLFATEDMIDMAQLFEIDEGDLDAGRSIN